MDTEGLHQRADVDQKRSVMPEETIYCPQCNQKVRVPEELLGTPVQCPLCQLVFVAPSRGTPPVVAPAPAPEIMAPPPPLPVQRAADDAETDDEVDAQFEAVWNQVRPPAMALLLLGGLGWLSNALNAVMTRSLGRSAFDENVADFRRRLAEVPASPERDSLERLINQEFLYDFQLALTLGLLFLCTAVLISGAQMLRLRHYWLAVLGSVLVMFNLNLCCCVLGIPVGIWCLRVLMRPEVRRAFE